jgi:hypothetical protein
LPVGDGPLLAFDPSTVDDMMPNYLDALLARIAAPQVAALALSLSVLLWFAQGLFAVSRFRNLPGP